MLRKHCRFTASACQWVSIYDRLDALAVSALRNCEVLIRNEKLTLSSGKFNKPRIMDFARLVLLS